MTDKQYVIRACEMLKLDLFKPTRGDKTILVYDDGVQFRKLAVEASTWAQAKQQLDDWRMKRAQG